MSRRGVLTAVTWAAALGCATPSAPPAPRRERTRSTPRPRSKPRPRPPRARTAPFDAQPWWATIAPGLYRREGRLVVMATGLSTDHQHPAEGFLQAKVRARLAVRRAAGVVAVSGRLPEPTVEDVHIAPRKAVWALVRLELPPLISRPGRVGTWTPPKRVARPGRRRIGGHIFEDHQHLYLECPIEGPVTNPDWGQTRATARWTPRRNRWSAQP